MTTFHPKLYVRIRVLDVHAGTGRAVACKLIARTKNGIVFSSDNALPATTRLSFQAQNDTGEWRNIFKPRTTDANAPYRYNAEY